MIKRTLCMLAGALCMAMPSSGVCADNSGIVVVAGATGLTGRLVVKHLLQEGFAVRAMVRSMEKGRNVLGEGIELVQADVTDPSSLPAAVAGAGYVISAIGTGGNASPEDVDYKGSVALIDAAKAAGVKKFIMVTSGGVTWRLHPINWFSGGVLKWKRKAEIYLRGSGMTHVIVRPNGGLTDDPVNTNRITFTQSDDFGRRISRDDVAFVCVRALVHPEADNKTFEIQNDDDGSLVKDVDWPAAFAAMKVQSDNF